MTEAIIIAWIIDWWFTYLYYVKLSNLEIKDDPELESGCAAGTKLSTISISISYIIPIISILYQPSHRHINMNNRKYYMLHEGFWFEDPEEQERIRRCLSHGIIHRHINIYIYT